MDARFDPTTLKILCDVEGDSLFGGVQAVDLDGEDSFTSSHDNARSSLFHEAAEMDEMSAIRYAERKQDLDERAWLKREI